jgi:hypothetical protein
MEKQTPPSMDELIPHLTPEEQTEAKQNLDQYVQLITRICNRLAVKESLVKLIL